MGSKLPRKRTSVIDTAAIRSKAPLDNLAAWMSALVAPALVLVWVVIVAIAVPHAAVHLCKWPATISCDGGVPALWWTFAVAMTAIVAAGIADCLWLRARSRAGPVRTLLYGGWVVAVVINFLSRVQDRELSGTDLVAGAVLVIGGTVLAGWTLASRPSAGRRARRAAWATTAASVVGAVVVVSLSPGWFERSWERRGQPVDTPAVLPVHPAQTAEW
jgi:hypothetical protein